MQEYKFRVRLMNGLELAIVSRNRWHHSQRFTRFIITTATPQQFIILHTFKKKYNGAIKNSHKRPAQERLKRLQERENQ